jgi:hypothetical protein
VFQKSACSEYHGPLDSVNASDPSIASGFMTPKCTRSLSLGMTCPNPAGQAPPTGYVTSAGERPEPFQQLGKSITAMIPSTNSY